MYVKNSGQMTKMATMPIFSKNRTTCTFSQLPLRRAIVAVLATCYSSPMTTLCQLLDLQV